jgi:hypothetical protein
MLSRLWCLSIATLVTLTACTGSDAATGLARPNADDFRLTASATELAKGEALTLRITSGGVAVDARAVTWETRNARALSVTNGVVRALAPGMGYIVARSGQLADSISLAVRFSGALGGGAVFQVGADDNPIRLSGLALQLESLRSDYKSTDIIAHSRGAEAALSALDAAFSGDSILSIHLPRQLEVGRHALGAFTVEHTTSLRISGDEGVYLRLKDGNLRWRMYFAVGTSTLEITSVQLPAAMGNIPGKLTGRVQFDAAGFVHSIDDRGAQRLTPISDRVVPIYAEFSVDIYRHPISGLAAEIGGRYSGTARMGGAGAMDAVALTAYWNGLLNVGTPNETFIEASLRVGAPAVGSFVLSNSTGAPATLSMQFAKFVRTPPGNDPSGQIKDPITGMASSGTVTITEFRAPTGDNFGVLRARLNATVDFPAGSPATVSITDLVLPIVPLKGDVLDPAPAKSFSHQ